MYLRHRRNKDNKNEETTEITVQVKKTYFGQCLPSKLSINLSEWLVPFECGTVCFSE